MRLGNDRNKGAQDFGPKMFLTFTLHDGTRHSKVCGFSEAMRELSEAKTIPPKWRDFKIAPDVCHFCDSAPALTVIGPEQGTMIRVCGCHVDDYRRPCSGCHTNPMAENNDTGLCLECEEKETIK